MSEQPIPPDAIRSARPGEPVKEHPPQTQKVSLNQQGELLKDAQIGGVIRQRGPVTQQSPSGLAGVPMDGFQRVSGGITPQQEQQNRAADQAALHQQFPSGLQGVPEGSFLRTRGPATQPDTQGTAPNPATPPPPTK